MYSNSILTFYKSLSQIIKHKVFLQLVLLGVEMLRTKHNAGFFSCCSVRLHDIIAYFNTNKCLPKEVDSSGHFGLYKKDSDKDITYDYFKEYNHSTSIQSSANH